MRYYICTLWIACFLCGCDEQTQPRNDKTVHSTSIVTNAQFQEAADRATAMRLLADAIDAGKVKTVDDANAMTKAQALNIQQKFNADFSQALHDKFHIDDNASDDTVDILPSDAAATCRQAADEFDAAANGFAKKNSTNSVGEDKPQRRRTRRGRSSR